ncbi:MAG: FAD-dependent oxidoreductase [Cetobacterium sp.]|uniref:FAD-dependent oxidoreductase n=1 Tax=Cetobacterium sp. TaxID=2071632 RepID=UPI002FC9A65E
MKKYDAVIIGFGKGGKTLASYLGDKGLNVALIEKSNTMYGGTCINIGCIPSKILVENKNHDYSEVIEKKNNIISNLRQKNFDKLNNNPNVTIYNGVGSFVSNHEIKITYSEKEETIYGDKIFINTGSESIIPDIPGINKVKNIYTSTTLMNLKVLPKRLVIVGAGYIGMEFASIYNNFGAKVTLLESKEDIILRDEPEVREEVKNIFQERNIKIRTEIKVIKFDQNKDEVHIHCLNKEGEIEILKSDAVLLATGRKPNLKSLNLENAGIDFDEKGVIVDKYLKTNIDNIYALGDVTGGLQFTYLSLDDFRIVKSQLEEEGNRSRDNRGAVAYSVFISPTMSKVGMTEKEALENGYEVKTKIIKASTIPRAIILEEERGILKVIIDSKTDLILGATLLCAESSEIINFITSAINEKKPYHYLRDFIYTHPTMIESFNDLFSL